MTPLLLLRAIIGVVGAVRCADQLVTAATAARLVPPPDNCNAIPHPAIASTAYAGLSGH